MPGTAAGAPSGHHHLCRPLQSAVARGVSPGFGPLWVFIGSLRAKPDASGSRLCHASSSQHTPRPPAPNIWGSPDSCHKQETSILPRPGWEDQQPPAPLAASSWAQQSGGTYSCSHHQQRKNLQFTFSSDIFIKMSGFSSLLCHQGDDRRSQRAPSHNQPLLARRHMDFPAPSPSWTGLSRPEPASSDEVSQPPKGSLPLGDFCTRVWEQKKGTNNHSDTELRQDGGSRAASRDIVQRGAAVVASVVAQVRDQAANPTPQLPKLSAATPRPPQGPAGLEKQCGAWRKSPALRR